MSWLLAVDTAVERGSLALIQDGSVHQLREIPRGLGHERELLLEVDALLREAGIRVAHLDAFASTSGPGSFTGVRVGLTLIKAFGETLDRPAYGISTLQAMAWYGTTSRRVPVIDARRGEVYCALYDASLELLDPEVAMSWDTWKARLQGDEELLTMSGNLVDSASTPVSSLAAAVGLLAWQQWFRRVPSDALTLEANYVRRSDVEMKWSES